MIRQEIIDAVSPAALSESQLLCSPRMRPRAHHPMGVFSGPMS
ncbi:MAG: hypothetical protein ACJAYX_000537 [Planctomycetota bacterium]|jgi:hypothetical protein